MSQSKSKNRKHQKRIKNGNMKSKQQTKIMKEPRNQNKQKSVYGCKRKMKE